MFWTDWGLHPKIERAFLDGSTRKVVISNNLGIYIFEYHHLEFLILDLEKVITLKVSKDFVW